jgi:hypothetical protein
MHGLMATCAPTGALLQLRVVRKTANANDAALDLLEMALQTKIRVANRQHFGVDRAMGRVTRRASFAQRFVFECVRAPLRGMTLNAIIVLR